jgi:hypothetical protein
VRLVRDRIRRDERGASLVLAIAFMLVIGGISGAVLSSVASGLNDRTALDRARNREYAADGLVDYAIAQARVPIAQWSAGSPASVSAFLTSATSTGCGGPYSPSLGNVPPAAQLNNVNIRVDCTPAPALTRSGYIQRNAIFTACLDTGVACTDASSIVRAQVNFSDLATDPARVQAWSVNG